MGRPRESGYRSQLFILLVLREYRPLYGQEIVNKSGLHREEVWRNLNVLLRKGIIKKKRVGRKTYYEPNVHSQTLEYIIVILYEGGLRKMQEKFTRFFKEAKRPFNQMISAARLVEEYESELIKLAYTTGMEPYFENLPDARSLKETEKEMVRVGLKKASHLPESRKTEMRRSVLRPKKLETKDVKLSSGSHFTIRKMSALELLDIVRKINRQDTHTPKVDPYLIEAVKRLVS